MDEHNTPEAVPSEVDVAPVEGGGNGSDVANLKDILGTELGRNFQTDEAALKAVKDTFSYVGEYGQVKPVFEQLKARAKEAGKPLTKFMEEIVTQKPEQPVQPTEDLKNKVETLEATLRDSTFFAEHPEYAPYKEMIKTMGKDPNEVVKSEVFQSTFAKLKVADDTEKSKSVIHSNPRLGQAADKISQAKQATDQASAAQLATDAVMEAFELL